MSDRRRKNDQLARLLQLGFALALIFLAPVCAGEEKTGKHLFILSGQSNMTGAVKAAFTAHVEEQNSVVVMRMKSGRGIRFWVADYDQPADRGLTEKKMTSNGQEYKPLLETALAAVKAQSFDTVGFIWMQGESDANNRLSEVYEESFLKLVEQLRKDLKREDLYYVIGRINDYARSRPDNAHWHRVREAQVKLGKSPGNAWIDTDDLNGGDADNPDGDIHFPRDGAASLGQRFAKKAIELITTRSTGSANKLELRKEE
ncbi:sialate O-acetylesterase [bacterium]|nr:sialate O-acetylesterase [bacterium]MDB4753048.1 sialate O-acetylesterase [bacterium]